MRLGAPGDALKVVAEEMEEPKGPGVFLASQRRLHSIYYGCCALSRRDRES